MSEESDIQKAQRRNLHLRAKVDKHVVQRDKAWAEASRLRAEIAKLRAEREPLLALLKAARNDHGRCPVIRGLEDASVRVVCETCEALARCKEIETP